MCSCSEIFWNTKHSSNQNWKNRKLFLHKMTIPSSSMSTRTTNPPFINLVKSFALTHRTNPPVYNSFNSSTYRYSFSFLPSIFNFWRTFFRRAMIFRYVRSIPYYINAIFKWYEHNRVKQRDGIPGGYTPHHTSLFKTVYPSPMETPSSNDALQISKWFKIYDLPTHLV